MINKSWINCLYRCICHAKVLFTIFSCKWFRTVYALRHHLVQPVPMIIKPTPFIDNLFENYSPAGRQRMEFRCQFGVAYQTLKIQCNAVAHDQREVVLIIINIIQQLLPSSSVRGRSMFLLWARSVVHDVYCARTDSTSPRIYIHLYFTALMDHNERTKMRSERCDWSRLMKHYVPTEWLRHSVDFAF